MRAKTSIFIQSKNIKSQLKTHCNELMNQVENLSSRVEFHQPWLVEMHHITLQSQTKKVSNIRKKEAVAQLILQIQLMKTRTDLKNVVPQRKSQMTDNITTIANQ